MTDGDTDKQEGYSAAIIAAIVFLLAAAALAAVINALGYRISIPPEWRLAAFAFFIVLMALVFGRKWPVDGDFADLAFSVLTALGIVLLFFDAGADRLRISLAGEHTIKRSKSQIFQQKRPELERALGEVGPLLQKFRQAARSSETKARREKALSDCEALQPAQAVRNMQRQLEEAQRRSRSVPISPGAPAPFHVPRVDEGVVAPVDCRRVVASDPDLEALANVSSSHALGEIIRRQSVADLRTELGLDLGTLTVEDLGAYLDLALDGANVKTLLDGEQARLDKDVAEVGQRFDALVPSVEHGAGTVAWVRQFLWPYLLLSAVGLGVARKDFVKSLRQRQKYS